MNISRLATRVVGVSSVLALVAAVGCSGSNGDPNSCFGCGDGDGHDGGGSGGDGGGGGFGDGGGGFQGSDGGGTIGGDGGLAACATAEATASRTPVYMLIVVDGSGSMDFAPQENDPLKAGSQRGVKWLAVRGALHAFWDGLVAKPDNSLGVGLYLFSSSSTKSATAIDVGIKAVDATQAAALETRVDPNVTPNGGTPLKDAYEGQLPLLKSFTPSAPLVSGGKLVMVVMTDGVPDSGANTIISDATAAFAGTPKVTTFAVGVGDPTASASDYDEVFMGKLAVAGGAPAAGCTPGWNQSSPAGQTPCHFQITPKAKTAAMIQDEFLTAINTIRDQVSSCTFTLDKSGGAIDPSKVNVVYTSSGGASSTVPQDPTNGWSYDNPTDPSTVTLNGTACDTLKGDSNGSIKIVLGCATQVPK
ncbi:MAG: vWA domain-containing protein [Polyangiaceae bacterium]